MKLKAIGLIGSLLILLIVSCQNDQQVEFTRYFTGGSLVYQTHCQNCHGTNGEGLQGLIPPLTDSAYLKKNKASLACSIKFGLKGKININNREFEGEMPANDISPIEMARVLTYVTNSFGNKGGTISLDMVNADLANCK